MAYKYKATFTSEAKVINPSEQDRFVAKASLAALRGILPPDINPEDNPDLLYISCNGSVGGLVNRNDDGVTNETAIAINDSMKHKFITTDHDRSKAVGVILYPGFSRFVTNEPLTYEQSAALKEPVNMAFAGVLWKVINPMLAKYIRNNADDSADSLSMSWEISFNSYSIAVGSKNLFDARIIKADHPDFAAYDRYLRVNKGEGKDPSGNGVYRIIGDDSLIMGMSIVPNPAAEVKGILPIENIKVAEPVNTHPDDKASDLSQIPPSQRAFLEEQAQSNGGFHLCDITMQDGQIHSNIPVIGCRYIPKSIEGSKVASVTICKKSEENNITHSNASVNPDTAITMTKITNLQEFEAVLGKFEGKAAEAAAAIDFVKKIQEFSDKYAADLAAKENIVKTVEAAQAKAEERAKELETKVAEVEAKLAEVEAESSAVAAAQKFQERMAAFDEAFDLDVEDTKIIASDITNLDDEAFAAYMTKSKKLMAAKAKKKKAKEDDSAFNSKKDEDDKAKAAKKGGKKDPDDDDEDGDEDDGEKPGNKKDDKSSKAAATDKATKLIQAAIASIVANKGESTVTHGTTQTDPTALEEMTAAFGESFKIDGKAVKSAKKNKTA
jgi:hypothetical protein